MPKPRIVVVGSANMDIVAHAPRLPKPGETIIGTHSIMQPGGKGANQAVAAALLGGHVHMIARVGQDLFGDALMASLRNAGVDVQYVTVAPAESTGIALIGVDSVTGENSILVASGANGALTTADIAAAEDVIAAADVLVCSLEVPLAAIEAAIDLAHRHGVRSILNPAPAMPLPLDLIRKTDILTPNEHEVVLIAPHGDVAPEAAANRLIENGANCVVVTLGPKGAAGFTRDRAQAPCEAPAPRIGKVVDTTAAGDCFTGALSVALGEGQPLHEAMNFACHAAALSVMKAGAQSSLPTREEAERFQAAQTRV